MESDDSVEGGEGRTLRVAGSMDCETRQGCVSLGMGDVSGIEGRYTEYHAKFAMPDLALPKDTHTRPVCLQWVTALGQLGQQKAAMQRAKRGARGRWKVMIRKGDAEGRASVSLQWVVVLRHIGCAQDAETEGAQALKGEAGAGEGCRA